MEEETKLTVENGTDSEATSIEEPNVTSEVHIGTPKAEYASHMTQLKYNVVDSLTAHQRELQRIRSRRRRERMTDEQRALERERQRIRARRRRENMTEEQKLLVREQQQIRARMRRENMDDEQRALERERQRMRARERRRKMGGDQNSDDQKLALQRERQRIRARERRKNMTEEQRAMERERRRRARQQRGEMDSEEIALEREARDSLDSFDSLENQGETTLGNEITSQGEERTLVIHQSGLCPSMESLKTKLEHNVAIRNGSDGNNSSDTNQDITLAQEHVQAEVSTMIGDISTVTPDVSGWLIEPNSVTERTESSPKIRGESVGVNAECEMDTHEDDGKNENADQGVNGEESVEGTEGKYCHEHGEGTSMTNEHLIQGEQRALSMHQSGITSVKSCLTGLGTTSSPRIRDEGIGIKVEPKIDIHEDDRKNENTDQDINSEENAQERKGSRGRTRANERLIQGEQSALSMHQERLCPSVETCMTALEHDLGLKNASNGNTIIDINQDIAHVQEHVRTDVSTTSRHISAVMPDVIGCLMEPNSRTESTTSSPNVKNESIGIKVECEMDTHCKVEKM